MGSHGEPAVLPLAPLYGMACGLAVLGVQVHQLRALLLLRPLQRDGLRLFPLFGRGQLVLLQSGDKPGGKAAPSPAHNVNHTN